MPGSASATRTQPRRSAWAKRADDEARLALEEDGSLADAHLAIASAAGTVYGGFDWHIVLDRSAAALALDPSLDLAHLARMRAYYHLGLFEEATREGHAAARLNPGHSVELDRLEVALLLFDGHFDRGGRTRGAAHGPDRLRGRPALSRAGALLRRRRERQPRDARSRPYGATSRIPARRPRWPRIEAATGLERERAARIAAILSGTDLDHHVAYSLGAAFAQLGDPAASLTWLERAADTGFPCYPWFARDALLDPAAGHAPIRPVLARLKDAHEDARRRRR